MSAFEGFYYNKQLRNYLLQFMAIFAGMQVEVGKRDDVEPKLITIPVKNASKSRVVAAIKSENTQNKPIRLPLFSATLLNLDLAPELRKGVGQTRRNTYTPSGGLLPDDVKVVQQRQAVPYKGIFELGIWASNQDQHYQILEQILTIFDPVLQIQTSDELFDFTKITMVELTDVRFEENISPGSDRRIIQTTLQFQAPLYLSLPAEVHKQFVENVYTRIGIVSQVANNSEDVISELNQQGLDYNLDFSFDDDLDIS